MLTPVSIVLLAIIVLAWTLFVPRRNKIVSQATTLATAQGTPSDLDIGYVRGAGEVMGDVQFVLIVASLIVAVITGLDLLRVF